MLSMRVLWTPLVVLIFVSLSSAGTPGVFQGQVYQDQKPGWIFVQGRNGMLRRVEVSQARVVYASSVPAVDRARDPAADLVQGAEVRVTAEQDRAGEWRASRIEIVRISRGRNSRPQARAEATTGKAL
jgi:hypothetical protein